MIYDQIPAKEARFAKKKTCAYGKIFKASDSKVINGAIRLTHPKDNWYYKKKTKKEKIVLHFTAGILHGDIGELTRQKVSVPYVVARDGTVYELFHPDYWSYHLGRGTTGGNTIQSKKSIGIEISNYGPLKEESGVLKTWSGKPYCTLAQTEAYVKVDDFRGTKYFATYTDAQYRAVDSLITNLCRKYGILRRLPPKDDREKHFKGTPPGEGIWSHQNFRADKLDVGPAFDWLRVSGR